MHAPETVRRFIELRAQGWTYERLTTELNVTKPTLIAWSRKNQFEIQNVKVIEMESLASKWLASTSERVGVLGEQLRRVESALATRDLTALTTPQLMTAARNLRRQIEQVTGPLRFTVPVNEIPSEEHHEQVQDWKA
jgi:orotate phosphoribosyltransferase-like protein